MNTKRWISSVVIELSVLSAFAGENSPALKRPNIISASQSDPNTFSVEFPSNPGFWKNLLSDPEDFLLRGYGFKNESGEPALPGYTILIPVQPGYSRPHFTGLILEQQNLGQLPVARTPRLRRDGDPKAPVQFLNALTVFDSDSLIIAAGAPIQIEGQTVAPVTVYPLALNAGGTLTLRRRVQIRSTTPIQTGILTRTNGTGLPPVPKVHAIPTPDGVYQQLGGYLIITPPLFAPYLQNLVAWKQRKGHPVTVVNMAAAGLATADDIHEFIRNAYLNWPDPPRYVLLIGDTDQGLPAYHISSPEGVSRVTDFPYSLLTGDDDFPEVQVGRLSVDTAYELLVVISKIVHYESQPWMGDSDWFKRALMVATTVEAVSTAQTKNWVRRKMLDNGYTQVDTAFYPAQMTLNYVLNPITNGVGFVNYRGLGHYSGWSGPFMESQHIDQLNNGWKLPVVTSVVCGGGNFEASQDPCFGEKWIRAGTTSAPKGAVAFFGPSELYTHVMYNNAIDIGIYHAIFDEGVEELGEALWRGKLELWRNYHQTNTHPYDQSPEFYFHIYNLLGDPGLNFWTDTPQAIQVMAPDSLEGGDRYIMVQVNGADDQPLSGAFVYLRNDSNAVGLETGPNGRVVLPVTLAGGDLKLTVTGKNLLPELREIPVSSQEHAPDLTWIQWSASGWLTAGATVYPALEVTGGDADLSDVEISIESDSPWLTVLQGQVLIDQLGSGESETIENAFSIRVNAAAPDSARALIELTIDSGLEHWTQEFPVILHAAHLIWAPIIAETGNARPGETLTTHLRIFNQGSLPGSAGTATLLLPDEVQGTNLTTAWETIPVGGTYFSPEAVSLILADSLFPGDRVHLGLVLNTNSRSDTLWRILPLGTPGLYDPSIADGYGYRVFDNQDLAYSKTPVYNWYEIDRPSGGPGHTLPINDTAQNEDATVHIPLPFPVKYYGRVYTTATVCSNGWIALGSSPEVSFRNRTIPSPIGPDAMLAPFWDDLYTYPGRVSDYLAPDSSRYILEWKDVSNAFSGQPETFQVILNNNPAATPTGDTEIEFQYFRFSNSDSYENFATIGIEAPDATTGIEVSYVNQYDPSVAPLNAGRALRFTTAKGHRLPAAALTLDHTELDFQLNPWGSAGDSIALANVGASPLVYAIHPVVDNPSRAQPDWSAVMGNIPHTKGADGPVVAGRSVQWDTTDAFGYTWRDENEPHTPPYHWVFIETPDNALSNPPDPDDYAFGPIQVGFDFPFYEGSYTHLWVNSNGTLSFTSQAVPYFNTPLPSLEAPAACIAAWWDDLNGGGSTPGQIYAWNNGIDTSVVSFINMPRWGTSNRYTFQVILEIDGTITIQYGNMSGPRTSATVGIQNADRNIGLTVLNNSLSDLNTGSSVQFLRPHSWFSASHWFGTIDPNSVGYFTVHVSTRAFAPGVYSLPLQIVSNAENVPVADIMVNLQVILGDHPAGDVNLDYQVNILDFNTLVDILLQLRAASPGQLTAGDIVADGQLNIQDAVALIEFILTP